MTTFEYLCKTPSDINEHLPTLRDLARECTFVIEMGTRVPVSTWAFVEGLPEGSRLECIDIKSPDEYGGSIVPIENACKEKNIDFHFRQESSLECIIEECDMLFIDTLHEYEQLKAELARHSDKARKYIVMHDPISCPDMWQAGVEFLKDNKTWKLKALYENCNGLAIFERK